jgi:hypothetical protein
MDSVKKLNNCIEPGLIYPKSEVCSPEKYNTF